MLRIGLCGGSGSGKGYICNILKSMDFPCLDTDALVHLMYNKDQSLISSLAKIFGNQIISSSGGIDRKILREIVFSDRNALETLNITVHQKVSEYCRNWMDEHEKSCVKAVFIDAPQLFEAGMENDFHYIISVIAPEETRICRIIERDKITKEQATKRISNQLSNEDYIKRSHFVINNGENDNPEEQLKRILYEVKLIDKG